jgi:hypothetical protein
MMNEYFSCIIDLLSISLETLNHELNTHSNSLFDLRRRFVLVTQHN